MGGGRAGQREPRNRQMVRLLWPGTHSSRARVLRGGGLCRHEAARLGQGEQAADLPTALRAHGAVRRLRAGLVVAAEGRRGNATLRALRASDGLAPKALGAAADLVLRSLTACIPKPDAQGEEG